MFYMSNNLHQYKELHQIQSTVLDSNQRALAGLLVFSFRTSVLKHTDDACQNTHLLFPNIQCV